jgi:hypothetical protein
MRPRFLINLFSYCKASAANLGKERIEEEDFVKGLKTFSDDLIMDTTLELEDVCEGQGEFIYEFVNASPCISFAELQELSAETSLSLDQVLDHLIWQGFLGVIKKSDNQPIYIFDAGYNPKILKAHIDQWESTDQCLVVHPSFRPGLAIA